MDLENVRKKIFEENLGIGEYFSVAFDLLKIVFEEDRKLLFLQFILILGSGLIFFLGFTVIIGLVFSGYLGIRLIVLYLFYFILIVPLLTIAVNYFVAYFLRQIALKVERREDGLSKKELFIKVLIISGISFAIQISLFVLERLPFIGSFFAFLVNVGIIVIFIWALLYFWDVYYIRNLDLLESFDYSLKLSNGNRLKKIIPGVILIVGVVIGTIIIMPVVRIIAGGNDIIISIASSLIISLFLMYGQILEIVIFLNVENNYLKNEKENNDYNFKNSEEINYENNKSLENFEDK